MKQITLNFREVAVDGLPEKSMDEVLIVYPSGCMETSYSGHHKSWACRDFTPDELAEERRLIFGDITHWIPFEEVRSAFKEAETP